MSYAILFTRSDDFLLFPQLFEALRQPAAGAACIRVLGPDNLEVSLVIAFSENVCILGDTVYKVLCSSESSDTVIRDCFIEFLLACVCVYMCVECVCVCSTYDVYFVMYSRAEVGIPSDISFSLFRFLYLPVFSNPSIYLMQ